jgi:flagellar hook-length control protein FliK
MGGLCLCVNCGTPIAKYEGMNANLLQNMLEVTPAAGPASQSGKSSAGSESRWRQDPADNQNAPAEAVNTDNPQSNIQNDTSDDQPESFSDTLDKKITDSTPQDSKADENAEKPTEDTKKGDQTPEATAEGTVSAVQAELAQAGGAKVVNPVQQAAKAMIPGEAVSSIAKPETPKTASLIAESAKEAPIAPKQGVSEIAKQANKPLQAEVVKAENKPIQTETVVPENKPIQTEAAKAENKPDVPETAVIPAVRPEKANVIGMPEAAGDKFVAGGKDLTSQNGKAVLRDLTDVSAKPIAPDQKPVIVPANLSNRQTQQNGQESAAKTIVSDAKPAIETSQPTVVDKPAPVQVTTDQQPQTPLPGAQAAKNAKPAQILPAQGKTPQPAENAKAATGKADVSQGTNQVKTPAFELAKDDAAPVVSTYSNMTSQKPAQSQAPQPQTPVNPIANNPQNLNMDTGEQILVSGTTTTETVEPAPPAGAFAKAVSNVDSGPSVTDQIQDSIQSSLRLDRQQVVIRLDPPELGKVAIKFVENAGQITGILHVDKADTRDQIQRALPEIIQNLTNSGVQDKKIEVVLSNQNEQHTAKDQSSESGQNAWANQQNSSNPDSRSNANAYGQWNSDIDIATGFIEPQMQFVDDSINMLV